MPDAEKGKGLQMKIIKRSGKEVAFDGEKILAAIRKANKEVSGENCLTPEQIVGEMDCSVREVQKLRKRGARWRLLPCFTLTFEVYTESGTLPPLLDMLPLRVLSPVLHSLYS